MPCRGLFLKASLTNIANKALNYEFGIPYKVWICLAEITHVWSQICLQIKGKRSNLGLSKFGQTNLEHPYWKYFHLKLFNNFVCLACFYVEIVCRTTLHWVKSSYHVRSSHHINERKVGPKITVNSGWNWPILYIKVHISVRWIAETDVNTMFWNKHFEEVLRSCSGLNIYKVK